MSAYPISAERCGVLDPGTGGDIISFWPVGALGGHLIKAKQSTFVAGLGCGRLAIVPTQDIAHRQRALYAEVVVVPRSSRHVMASDLISTCRNCSSKGRVQRRKALRCWVREAADRLMVAIGQARNSHLLTARIGTSRRRSGHRSRPFIDASPASPPDRIGQHEHI